MYFLTEQDPNFRIKGSRDPLGFQPIWQSLGRNVIQYLSTVSGNIKDFQVLSYAWYFYGDRDPKNFLSFFYKFEQACGFARGKYIENDAFNGIDFVRKNLGKEVLTFSTRNQDTLLSNQKSYGIYGKYNRPFTEMKIKEHELFYEVMKSSLIEKGVYNELQPKVELLLKEDIVTTNFEEIKVYADMLSSLTQREKDFYKSLVLESNGHLQNELFELIKVHPELIAAEQFNLYNFINTVLKLSISEELKRALEEIKTSEYVLYPYVYLFKTIQSEPVWQKDKLETQPIFQSFPDAFDFTFSNEVITSLNNSLNSKPYEIAIATVNRNKDVSERRKNSPWVKAEENKVVVNYADGARRTEKFNTDVDFEHNYFLPTYISMYKQIMT